MIFDKRSLAAIIVVIVMVSTAVAVLIPSIDGSDGAQYDGYKVGDSITLYSGRGSTVHKEAQDVSSYAVDSKSR